MMTKSQLVLVGGLLLSLLLTPLLAGVSVAQSSAPLAALNIALWPEYDRPEVLVIYRGQVAEDVPLPAQVSFNLPAGVETLNAVAYVDQAQGNLLNLPDYQIIEGAEGKVLSFAAPSRQFQFEYYDDEMLSRDGQARELSFSFTPSTQVANLSFEVQQPVATQGFTSDPPPSETQSRQDGLTYALYIIGPVSAGDSRSLQASYTRSSDQLSAETLAGISLPSPDEQTPVEVSGSGLKDNLGPILIAVGVLLLTGSLVYWFWSQRSVVVPEPAPRHSSARSRRPTRRSKPGVSKSGSSPTKEETEKPAAYCHQCGTKFREGALFCHACGAERRAK
jgi:hypothetical protein